MDQEQLNRPGTAAETISVEKNVGFISVAAAIEERFEIQA